MRSRTVNLGMSAGSAASLGVGAPGRHVDLGAIVMRPTAAMRERSLRNNGKLRLVVEKAAPDPRLPPGDNLYAWAVVDADDEVLVGGIERGMVQASVTGAQALEIEQATQKG